MAVLGRLMMMMIVPRFSRDARCDRGRKLCPARQIFSGCLLVGSLAEGLPHIILT